MKNLGLNFKKACFWIGFLNIFTVHLSYAHTPLVIHCPSQIQTTQQRVASLENKSWHPFKPLSYESLSHIEVYSGLTENLAILKPDRQNARQAVWYFDTNHRYSLSCHYNNTSIQLTQMLPKNLTQCTLIYKKYSSQRYGGGSPDYLSCQ